MLYNFRISFEIKILAVKVNKSQLGRTKICCDYEQLQDGPTAVSDTSRQVVGCDATWQAHVARLAAAGIQRRLDDRRTKYEDQ